MQASIYDRWNLCSDLEQKSRCFRLMQYKEGKFYELFHEHVPKSRMSGETARDALRAMVCRYSEMHFDQILCAYLNTRGTRPVRDQALVITQSYPEPGVIRFYCGRNTVAWFDEVICKPKFRPS